MKVTLRRGHAVMLFYGGEHKMWCGERVKYAEDKAEFDRDASELTCLDCAAKLVALRLTDRSQP